MRRIASAIGPVLVFTAVTVPNSPAHSVEHHASQTRAATTQTKVVSQPRLLTSARRSSGIGLDSTSLGTSYVNVSWNWIRAASGYRVQVSKRSDFSSVVANRSKTNSRHRPAGGRESTVVGRLRDATYYWVRVRKVHGARAGSWSRPVRVATKAAIPDKFTSVKARLGADPGEARLVWKQSGAHTDYYKITTATTPFGSPKTPAVGQHSMTFRVPGNQRTVTLTPDQTAAAGAGLGSGRYLFYRITAVRSGQADTATRRFPFLMHTAIRGAAPSGTGGSIRIAQYNMHVASKDAPGHPWRERQYAIAKNIANVAPAVASIQELMPTMWDDRDGGVGLDGALRQAGAGRYELTRATPYWKNAGQDTRILYDPTKVQLISSCPDDVPSCYIMLPNPDHNQVAAYAKFRDIATGQAFYFVSAHLKPGNDAATDALRGRQIVAMSQGIKAINDQHLPVIFGSDVNSAQTSNGHDAPHQSLIDEGWYNTQSAAKVVNNQYNSVNAYKDQKPSPYGYGAMYDTIATLGMPGATLWKQVLTGSPKPSDHNLVFTDLRFP